MTSNLVLFIFSLGGVGLALIEAGFSHFAFRKGWASARYRVTSRSLKSSLMQSSIGLGGLGFLVGLGILVT